MACSATDTGNRVKAHCPGHITGIFTIEDQEPDFMKKGSRGLGFCTELGATSEVSFTPGTGQINISINSEKSDAPVTKLALQLMLPKLDLDITASIELQAPMGQGFGMSAAGTFATCLAAATALNIPEPMKEALTATHLAEIDMGSGLGDAAAMAAGGFVQRLAPGITHTDFQSMQANDAATPQPNAVRLATPDTEVLFCILGEKMSTQEIIRSPKTKEIISREGAKCLAEFEIKPDFDNFLILSNKFARDTGLLTREMSEALSVIEGVGRGSMVMLGNSIFAFGDIDKMEPVLTKHGKIIRTRLTQAPPSVM